MSNGKPVELNIDNCIASQVWNLMDGQLKWSELNSVLEYLEVTECEIIIACIINLKDYCDNMKAAQS